MKKAKLAAAVRRATEREKITNLGEPDLVTALGAVTTASSVATDDPPVDPQYDCPHLEYTAPA